MMIEAPLRQLQPGPDHDRVGREPPGWRTRSVPTTAARQQLPSGLDPSSDDVFYEQPREKVATPKTDQRELEGGDDREHSEREAGDQETREGSEAADLSLRTTEKDQRIFGSGRTGDVADDQPNNEHEEGDGDVDRDENDEVLVLVTDPLQSSTAYQKRDPSDHEKKLDNHKRRYSRLGSTSQTGQNEKVLKLTPKRIQELTTSPDSLPLRALSAEDPDPPLKVASLPPPSFEPRSERDVSGARDTAKSPNQDVPNRSFDVQSARDNISPDSRSTPSGGAFSRPSSIKRVRSAQRQTGEDRDRKGPRHTPTPLRFEDGRPGGLHSSAVGETMPSPMPQTIPLPPMSLPTYLQLELSSRGPSPLYIHRSVTSDFPYESSRVKVERLLNFLLLPPQLEQVLWFGTLACLDSWLYTFTILPLRLVKSFYILGQSWATNVVTEAQYVSGFIYAGTGRMWKRRRTRGPSESKNRPAGQDSAHHESVGRSDESTEANGCLVRDRDEKRRPSVVVSKAVRDDSSKRIRRHQRNKSVPSALLPDDKADILKGLLIITTCLCLMHLDASRMYHWIRGQAAIKLYVIYNLLEVGDRLLSAIGQDVLECLFSREALERGPDGHSKVLRPFWLFLLALTYTVVHATALFYQVITLNVAVNSYSNALFTLLTSNQFVEIKSTVFKKFEKENLFQLTCADVVERFQLWLMLLIIASRNIVETGGLSAASGAFGLSSSFFSTSAAATNTSSGTTDQPPRSATSILPRSFTLLPNTISSLTGYAPGIGHVLGPFLVVLGSEMLVDWLKHSYINKFNNTRPAIYGRFLDVLAKDYYSNAFADQNLTKRLGLPVIPLSCLFIRACVQTYQMFLAAWVPPSLPPLAGGLTNAHRHYTRSATNGPRSPTAALSQLFDDIVGQIPASITSSTAFANLSTILIFLVVFLVLLTLKLALGMLLLAFARSRYRSMKEREKDPMHQVEGGRRVGGWGVVEVDDDKRRWIYDGDSTGTGEGDDVGRLHRRHRRRRGQSGERDERENTHPDVKNTTTTTTTTAECAFERVKRYEMVAKRIW